MKKHVMQPFRAPRQQKEKASPTRQSPRRQGKQDKQVHAIPVVIKETQFDNIEEVVDCSFVEATTHRWGLPDNCKILWTMSDEKWWVGLVSRTFAKMCPALGIEKEVFSVHHKNILLR